MEMLKKCPYSESLGVLGMGNNMEFTSGGLDHHQEQSGGIILPLLRSPFCLFLARLCTYRSFSFRVFCFALLSTWGFWFGWVFTF